MTFITYLKNSGIIFKQLDYAIF